MRLTVLGCSGTYPGPDSPCSGYLVEHDGFRLVLDLGAGAVGELQRHVGLLDVDAVYVTHLHADHCIDLVALSYARRYHPDGAPPVLPVYGPAGLARRVCGAFEAPPPDGLREVYAFHEVATGTLQLGPLAITSVRSNHPVECHALRLEAGGRTLAYTADTGASQAVVDLARDVDLLLSEATWPHDTAAPPDLHLSGTEAGEHATRAGARRLLLTHLVPWADPARVLAEARRTYAGPLEAATRGRSYDV